jgi:hypothetical protein
MRLLLFDETIQGHHSMWMEQIALALSRMLGPNELYYAFPTPLPVTATHIYWKEPFHHRLLRFVSNQMSTTIHVSRCWAALDSLARRHQIDRVLLMLGDPFLHAHYLPRPSFEWVPIYFHPTHLRGSAAANTDRALKASDCPFIYVLDETIRDQLSRDVGKPVYKMPDFFDSTRSGPTPRTELLLRHAAGKPVICAIGPITPHKGIGPLVQIAERRPDWHILLVGTVQSKRHRREDLSFLRRARSLANVTWFDERIDHAELNELTALSTVHYAVYRNFLHSSNKLIRACENRRPLIVAEDGYMGEMVMKYRIGCTCKASVPESIETAISRAIHADWSTADWAGYEDLNSLDRLPEALQPLVSRARL